MALTDKQRLRRLQAARRKLFEADKMLRSLDDMVKFADVLSDNVIDRISYEIDVLLQYLTEEEP